jgi:hypothetical protein
MPLTGIKEYLSNKISLNELKSDDELVLELEKLHDLHKQSQQP